MALIHKGDRWTLQFRLRPNIPRENVALGAMDELDAKQFQKKINLLIKAYRAGKPPDPSTVKWVNDLPDALYEKLARAGLVVSRAPAESEAVSSAALTLGKFLDQYIAKRTDVKGNTAVVYGHTRRCLLIFFGADKPLNEITPGNADDFRLWLASKGGQIRGCKNRKKQVALADNTVRRRCGIAKQFFRKALRDRLIAENPFGDMKGCTVGGNDERDYFVTPAEAQAVLDACPDAEWRLLFALSRFGGLRCPSEHLRLRWGDVDLAGGRFTVHSPKTERHKGKGVRDVPIFPELRPYLEDAYALAREAAVEAGSRVEPNDPVITRCRDTNANLRTTLYKIIKRAKLKPWEKLFANLRATRATELVAAGWPEYKVCKWLGHSEAIAKKHYWQVTDEDYRKASGGAAPVEVDNGNSGGSDKTELQKELQICSAVQRNGMQQQNKKRKTPVKHAISRVSGGCGVGDEGLEQTHSNTEDSTISPEALQETLQILSKLPPDQLAALVAALTGNTVAK